LRGAAGATLGGTAMSGDPRGQSIGADAVRTHRREFLLALGKWSPSVVSIAVETGLARSAVEAAWLDSHGGSGNAR
jgi:hypothetical protein